MLDLNRFFIKTVDVDTIKTNIPVNASWDGSKAYLYLLSCHFMNGDGTYYDFGIIRFGHDGNHMTIYQLSYNQNLKGGFGICEDGYLQYTRQTTTPCRIILIG